jgi:D-alanine-D-alanine ligase
VLVADRDDDDGLTGPIYLQRDLDTTGKEATDLLISTVADLGLKIHRYNDPKELSSHAHLHFEDVVLSVYGGSISRNRLALVPAICEIHGLRYVGPDVYGRIICQDKEISKRLAQHCGLDTPWQHIIRTPHHLDFMNALPTPFVVKPLFEGTSIGITQRNLVKNANEGPALAAELLKALDQPIMIEGFVGGKEVAYTCIESASGNHWAYAELYMDDIENYFNSHLYDAETKISPTLRRTVRTIDAMLPDETRASLNNFLKSLGKFGYCRVDGKHYNDGFVFLEVTPDAWIGESGIFAASFINKGWSYAEIIASVLLSATFGSQSL